MTRNIMIQIEAYTHLPRKMKRGTNYQRILKRFYKVVKEFDLFLVGHELKYDKIRILSSPSEINDVIQEALKQMPINEIHILRQRMIF